MASKIAFPKTENSWGRWGNGDGEFQHPWGIAVDREGHVWACFDSRRGSPWTQRDSST
jgi:hypothetical protein